MIPNASQCSVDIVKTVPIQNKLTMAMTLAVTLAHQEYPAKREINLIRGH